MPEGNATATGVARAGAPTGRCGERQWHHDIEKHIIVDLQPRKRRTFRKNNLPGCVTYKNASVSGQVNTQANNEGLMRMEPRQARERRHEIGKRQQPERPLRLVHLPDIDARLFLGDGSVYEHTKDLHARGIGTIVHVGSALRLWNSKRDGLLVRVVPFNDDPKTMTWRAFSTAVRTACVTIDDVLSATDTANRREPDSKASESESKADAKVAAEAQPPGVVVVCERGINRSVAVVAAQAAALNGWSFSDAVSYIDSVKLALDKNWNTLTSPRVRNFLRAFMQQHRQQQASAESVAAQPAAAGRKDAGSELWADGFVFV